MKLQNVKYVDEEFYPVLKDLQMIQRLKVTIAAIYGWDVMPHIMILNENVI
jgi:hypothetical protein